MIKITSRLNTFLILIFIQLLNYSCLNKNQNPKTLIDPRDNKVYKCIEIGDQIWMVENLAYNAKGGKSVYYADDSINNFKFGRLYHLDDIKEAINIPGWHLPDTSEWLQLMKHYNLEDANFGAGKNHHKCAAWEKANYDHISFFLSNEENGFNLQYGGLWHLKWVSPNSERQKWFEYKNKAAYYWALPLDSINKYTHFGMGKYKYHWYEVSTNKPSQTYKSGDNFRFNIRLVKN